MDYKCLYISFVLNGGKTCILTVFLMIVFISILHVTLIN